jgi:type I restriction enzyme R subunit
MQIDRAPQGGLVDTYAAFRDAFFQGAIRMFQRDNEMRNIVLSDATTRDMATRHFFNRALREVREAPR